MTPQPTIEWLICAATRFELETFRREGEVWRGDVTGVLAEAEGIACAVTGVGIPETFALCGSIVHTLSPKRILNIGIAGAYPNTGLQIGDLIRAETEIYGDIGFELPDAPHFQPLGDSPFGAFYGRCGPLASFGFELPVGNGCTVNACTGSEAVGLRREQMFNAHFETMEGAAIAQIGRMANIPVCEIRAVSNEAARRDMRPENIKLALQNLRQFLQACREQGLFSCAS